MISSSGASDRVTFASSNPAGEGRGVLFRHPAKSAQGLIIVHEWWGMNDQIQTQGAEIAHSGDFTVLVPDMYRGKLADDRETAGHLMSGLDWPGALQDISGAARLLVARGCRKVGVAGFCMGGALSIAAAVKCPEISAASAFYGIPSIQLADPVTTMVPIQAHFAEKDESVGFCSPKEFNPYISRIKEAGKSNIEIYMYDVGHAFANPIAPNYNKEASDTALKRMYEFMNKHLSAASL